MVNLMLQPVFMNLVKGSTDHKMTSDDLYNMWSVASRAKSAIVQGRRLENLSWRLWYTSTIRTKIEMDERQKLKDQRANFRITCDRFSDGSNSGELSSTDQYSHNHDESSTEENSRDSDKSEKSEKLEQSDNKNSLVLPSDRPLFTSTCTSILAEIQDASFRFGQSGGNGFVGLHNFSNIHNFNSFSHHTGHGHSHGHGHLNNIVSPPITRAKSPANNLNNSNYLQPKRKKNVEKFLKKFKSNLEDITEQFDEKLGFTDEETNNEDSTTETTNVAQVEQSQIQVTEESLSPTYTINNFATDEEGPDSSFYSGENEFISIEKNKKSKINSKSQISMISRLLKKEDSITSSSPTVNQNDSKMIPEPIHQIPEPKFLYAANNNSSNTYITNNSDSFLNNQLELMAANRYNRFTTTSMTIKSPKPNPNINTTIDPVLMNKRVIDANALSTSLSANKFKLEDEFDSQIVIW